MAEIFKFPTNGSEKQNNPDKKIDKSDLPACPGCHNNDRLDVMEVPFHGHIVVCGCGFSAPHEAWLGLGEDYQFNRDVLLVRNEIDLAVKLADGPRVSMKISDLERISLAMRCVLVAQGDDVEIES